ncbi:RagB/SusD family nutrient uptake outer membrane protein [Maribellus luteus]|uniref:RagB/SusD family nutrient uptake outer membrane protein n=1 Tax=Maribellus luteus TaxID=2305463 RepID=A0A399T6M8_9BACT|nr:RagB/SusD family nutrient uptake outer membrane protein [Maribellus luteus]RIJ50819.1 RagB/SusD family nutrient uptake outer membrane protein [Maribellus luteus]
MKFISKILLTVSLLVFAYGCTDLSENLYSEILQEDFFKTENEVIAAIAPVYGNLRAFTNSTWELSTHSTDQTLTPEKALGHWAGSNWPLMNSHKWIPSMGLFNSAWNDQYALVNNSNKIIYQLEGIESMDEELKSLFLAELKMIRGFGYYNLIDLFGNVPLVTSWIVEDETPPTVQRAEVFNYAVNDIEANVENLSEKVDASTYGRFNKYSGYALLAKYYLNAEVWSATPQWDKVIEYCDKIIASEKYSLTDKYFDNFLIKNEGSKENIFVIPYDELYTNSWGVNLTFAWRALHYAHGAKYDFKMTPWNGFTAVPAFIHSFDSADKRLDGWLIGQQYGKSGEELFCSQESNGKPLNLTIDYENIYNPDDGIEYGPSYALEFMGARFAKYEYGPCDISMGNDFAVFRYADVLLMKAEALMRKNGGVANAEAVNLVNSVRSRAFDDPSKLYTASTLTLDALIAERGWELYGEGTRRTDLVRFGRFIKGTWEFYDRSWEDEKHNLYPIPYSQISANPDLAQNPGY